MNPQETVYLNPTEVAESLKQLGVGYRRLDDPFFEDGNKLERNFYKLGVYSNAEEEDCHKHINVACNVPGCNMEFNTVFGYESHYNSLHRYLCAECRKNLPSAHLLDLHLSEKHDSFFAVQMQNGVKPMYQCYVEQCQHKDFSAEQRKDHCITEHNFPPNFRFDIIKKKSSSPKDKIKKSTIADDETVDDTSTSSSSEATPVQSTQTPVVANQKLFNFGHSKNRSFIGNNSKPMKSNQKGLTMVTTNPETDILENNKMVDDLMESLPE